MKYLRLLLAAVLILSLLMSLCGCSSSGKSLNVKIMEVTKSTVRFRPVCPECDTVGKSRIEILYDGEGDVFTDTEMCEECWTIFDIGITRD